ncbi:MAG: M23 family metallopeptidase [Bacteroidales bacterium]|nr:M23 family metallopeptidase [Bacteroidales bacterium]
MADDNKRERGSSKYRLSVIDDVSHRRLRSVRFTPSAAVIAVLSVTAVAFAVFFALIAFTPLRTFIPGYPDQNTKRTAVQNAIRIDSLETEILRWELYTENLRRVVEGEAPVSLDSLIKVNPARADEPVSASHPADSALRSAVMKEEQFDLSGRERQLPLQGMHFFVPVKGVMSRPFEAAVHPGVDITSPAGAMVMAVLDGTVVFACWDDRDGQTVILQHSTDLLSVYRHGGKALCKVGDKVRAGAPVAVSAGSPGEYIHFELWYRGQVVDPSQYISF